MHNDALWKKKRRKEDFIDILKKNRRKEDFIDV